MNMNDNVPGQWAKAGNSRQVLLLSRNGVLQLIANVLSLATQVRVSYLIADVSWPEGRQGSQTHHTSCSLHYLIKCVLHCFEKSRKLTKS